MVVTVPHFIPTFILLFFLIGLASSGRTIESIHHRIASEQHYAIHLHRHRRWDIIVKDDTFVEQTTVSSNVTSETWFIAFWILLTLCSALLAICCYIAYRCTALLRYVWRMQTAAARANLENDGSVAARESPVLLDVVSDANLSHAENRCGNDSNENLVLEVVPPQEPPADGTVSVCSWHTAENDSD